MRNLQPGNRCCLLLAACLLAATVTCPNVSAVENSAQLYFFTSSGCPPCRQIEPSLEALTHEGYSITKIDVGQYPLWVQKFQVRSTPTLVLVKNNREIVRHSGILDQNTIRGWFQQADQPSSNSIATASPRPASQPTNLGPRRAGSPNDAPNYPTLHKGTRQPGNAIEQVAMAATVRLRVEDSEGFSYATGTVIHCHEGEWLVLTCGHMFRESQGRGVITAEYEFANDSPKKAPAELITYDAEARDVALVAVKAGVNVKPVQLAGPDTPVVNGGEVFSIGCDHGDFPTIRKTKLKNQAKYDGVKKYEIFGRPVVGRSGGGLFNGKGELIGVCNAAAVDFDEGIYSSLDNIHWQIAKVDFEHLFAKPNTMLASNVATPNQNSVQAELPSWENVDSGPQTELPSSPRRDRAQLIPSAPITQNARPDRFASLDWDPDSRPELAPAIPPRRNVSWENGIGSSNTKLEADDMEVIVVVRSKSNPRLAEAFTLPNPSRELLGYLEKATASRPERRDLNVAQLRQDMPYVQPPSTRGVEFRAQSPR